MTSPRTNGLDQSDGAGPALVDLYTPEGLFRGGGETGALMLAMDWSRTSLGPVESWPQNLKTCVRIVLTARQPMFIWWGDDFINLYNDAYRPIAGLKHPMALGRPASEVWAEIWDQIESRAESAMRSNEGTYDEALMLIMERYGYKEETYYTFSYSPVPNDDGGTGGIFCANSDDTARILSQRQLTLLGELAARTADARTWQEACYLSTLALASDARDICFSAIYILDEGKQTAALAGTSSISPGHPAAPESLLLGDNSVWPIAQAQSSHEMVVLNDLDARFADLPCGGWDCRPSRAAVVPISPSGPTGHAGAIVIGLSPYRLLDENYLGFLKLIASQVSTSIANADAYEQERRRAESLAKLDLAKTTFFSNVSHEFRTPLTLMLGPLEDMLQDRTASPQITDQLHVVHRNGVRLLKLVNTLLDFSRIESGRTQAVYEPLDLTRFTTDLASVFRAATERAGMQLVTRIQPLPELVFVDREMWEKIVLNLLSNAFKFTLEGKIEVALSAVHDGVELKVSDTGCGIAPEDLPYIFERFYSSKSSRGRSFEGSGIGLALVQELVKLHGGTVRAESTVRKGTTFTVSIPFGQEHLPVDRVGASRAPASTAVDAAAYVEEVLRWIPESTDADVIGKTNAQLVAIGAQAERSAGRARILLADDNADMREYLVRLLAGAYDLEVVSDGQAALDAALRHAPDLILSDVMMPNLDGFGLLNALRANQATATVPVILLSARAGPEQRVEGISAGADDYLVKPFSARELIARVETHLSLSRMRREAETLARESEERFRALVTASSDVIYRMSADWTEMRQLRGRDFIADTEEPSKSWLEKYIHPDDRPRVLAAIEEAILNRTTFELEHRVLLLDGSLGWTFSRAVPLLDEKGEIKEWFGTASDITTRKLASDALMRSEKLASVGRMAATIAHEINNPLEAVTNALYLARCTTDDPAALQQYLDIADEELSRVAHITRQTLGFYRESAGPRVVSLNGILDSTLNVFRNKITATHANVVHDYQGDFSLTAIAGELRQVFSNLLANSLDAIDQGGTIKIRVSRSTIADGLAALRVTVADNGKGISAENLPRIFEPLFTTKVLTGTGLGLWVAKQIVEKQGGSIRVRSSSAGRYRGTAFSVLLPIEAPED